jgi:hypothetical protein
MFIEDDVALAAFDNANLAFMFALDIARRVDSKTDIIQHVRIGMHVGVPTDIRANIQTGKVVVDLLTMCFHQYTSYAFDSCFRVRNLPCPFFFSLVPRNHRQNMKGLTPT